MKVTFLKIKLISGRQVLTLLAIFFAALAFGYLGESKSVQTSDQVTRRALIKEMGRVLKVLKPILKSIDEPKTKIELDADFPADLSYPINLGLIKNFPDGSWKLEDLLTRGEALNYFSSLIDFLKGNLLYDQLILEGHFQFEDIPTNHWLESGLNKLFGIGAMANVTSLKLFPDDLMRTRELRSLSSRMIEYFSSNMFIILKGEKNLSIIPKGALKELDLSSWEVSFDGINWYETPMDGRLPLPDDEKKNFTLFFKHPNFLKVGPIETPTVGAATIFVKLRRDYVSFTRENLGKLHAKKPLNNKSELNRIKERLAEIKKRKLGKENPVIAKHIEPQVPLIPKVITEKKKDLITLVPSSGLQEETGFYSKEAHENALLQKRVLVDKVRVNEDKIIRIEGQIVDSLNGKPIEGVMLVVGGKSQKVDSTGNFAFNSERHKVLEITAYCEGYSVLQMKHRAGYKKGILALRLKPELTSFSGKVICYEKQVPVNQALIKVGDRATRTNSDGTFTIRGIRPGYHQISCFARNFLEAHEIVFVRENQKEKYNFEIRQEFSADPTSFASDNNDWMIPGSQKID